MAKDNPQRMLEQARTEDDLRAALRAFGEDGRVPKSPLVYGKTFEVSGAGLDVVLWYLETYPFVGMENTLDGEYE